MNPVWQIPIHAIALALGVLIGVAAVGIYNKLDEPLSPATAEAEITWPVPK